MNLIGIGLFLVGLISSFVVGGNNSATSLGILISTNSMKRKYSYLLSSISMFLGVSVGGISLQNSVRGTVMGGQPYLSIAVFSVFLASVISFYYLNRAGIPSSLSQMIYPSLAILVLLSRELELDWSKFWFTVVSWLFFTIFGNYIFTISLFRSSKNNGKREKKS
ncbi:inorganic phosphate transporter [Metallosphaera hakonensis]|uniref:inorganic phosphate transporter n=1 Tax=Metallosphaera hakonensis TaxID=79601 RepID=UPI000B16AC94|nr:inorganic phosphate transporter [Metallosphaera hakonensis]